MGAFFAFWGILDAAPYYFNILCKTEELAAAHTKYKNAWQRENKDRIPITVPIGDKDRIAAWAKSKGYQSTNSYITDLIYKDMGER